MIDAQLLFNFLFLILLIVNTVGVLCLVAYFRKVQLEGQVIINHQSKQYKAKEYIPDIGEVPDGIIVEPINRKGRI